jgi:histidinol dehydrogenase
MQPERFELRADPEGLAAQLRARVPAPTSVHEAVAEIITGVRQGGDEALIAYTRRFDTAGTEPGPLQVSDDELDRAARALSSDVRRGLEQAVENVSRVAKAAPYASGPVRFDGHEVILREAAVRRAGVYVPGGRAPYPSTVVMGAVTARVAGVGDVVVGAPPGPDGDVHPVVLGACRLARVSSVYRMGGAQAIAALAYGTESVMPVDVIVGPGNLYVQEAKRQVFGQVGIDGFAGPSDVLVIADAEADPEPVALDLLAQAEHGPGTLVIAVSTSAPLLELLNERVGAGNDTGAVGALVHAADLGLALALAEAFAPEHLELIGPEAERLAPSVSRAGCLFVGAGGATAFGDYVAGSNHVLPTNGAARFSSGLSPAHFRRSFAEVRIGTGAGALARAAAPVARAEGFELHARSMEARIRDNTSHDPQRRDRPQDR